MIRAIAATLCLLYVSVSTVFAAVHHHDASFDDQHCWACSWHHDGMVDEPPVTPDVVRPETLVFFETAPSFIVREGSLGGHPGRGPPLILL